jgi:hypothetical protein
MSLIWLTKMMVFQRDSGSKNVAGDSKTTRISMHLKTSLGL